MAIRYTAKLYETFETIGNLVRESDMPEETKQKIYSLIAYGEGFVQAGRLVACGNTLRGFEMLTGLSVEQMKETAQYRAISALEEEETVVISCPRSWYNFIRALLKSDVSSKRFRTKKVNESDLMVTRTK
jgi:hypothetical protein